MKAEVETAVKVTVSLTEEEARWLKAVMQNPVRHAFSPDGDEDAVSATHRRELFNTLNMAGI